MLIDWKVIGQLTDKNVLGTDGLSTKEPRRTSRAILINEDGQYAVMHVEKFNLHSLPGGGIDNGENELSALIREVFEETGCSCDAVEPLGIVSENRYHADYTSLSYYFVVRTKNKTGNTAFDRCRNRRWYSIKMVFFFRTIQFNKRY